jgi:hypothetical protein
MYVVFFRYLDGDWSINPTPFRELFYAEARAAELRAYGEGWETRIALVEIPERDTLPK